MRVLISAILIIVISMTGTVFAIEENPAAVDSEPVVSTSVDETKAEEPTIDPRDATETKDPDDPTLILDEDLPSGFDRPKPIDETFQNTMQKSGDKLLSELPEMDTMFTTPIFKIIVLVVGILFVILLLSILAKKKDTKYVAPRNKIRKAKKKEDVNTNAFANPVVEEPIVIAPIEPVQPEEPTESINVIEPIDQAKSELDLEETVSEIEDDFLLNIDNEASEELGLSEDITEDIDVVLEEKPKTEIEEIDIDEIDDIDELSKAIQEKEEQLKQLEEEVKTEKENKVKEVEEVIEEKVEDPFSDFKVEEEPAEKPAKKTKAKKSEKTEAVGSAEDFLKNMEKTMKEDKNK